MKHNMNRVLSVVALLMLTIDGRRNGDFFRHGRCLHADGNTHRRLLSDGSKPDGVEGDIG